MNIIALTAEDAAILAECPVRFAEAQTDAGEGAADARDAAIMLNCTRVTIRSTPRELRLINPTVFPIRIRMSCALLEELIECEMGSFEDFENAKRTNPDNYIGESEIHGTVHRVEILKRHECKSHQYMGTIEMRDYNEVAEVYYGACSGTFQIDRTDEEDSAGQGNWGDRGYRAAVRLCDKLRPILQESDDPEIVQLLRQWSAPAGV